MKKKVTVVINGFGIGGAEHMVAIFVNNLNLKRFHLNVLCYMEKEGTMLETAVEKVCPITYLNVNGHITLRTVGRVVSAICKTNPDIVHAHLGGAGFAAIWSMLTKRPVVITVHSKPEKAFSPKIEKLIRFALKHGNVKLVAVSEKNKHAVQMYYGVGDHQCVCINNGIDLSRFTQKKHEEFTLINVARHDGNKNQAALIRCFARFHKSYPQSQLLLVGDGVTHQQLVEQVEALNLQDAVTFTGNVSNTQDYYAISDLYVQTSHREAMPLSVLEAMAAGLPVVSTDVGGLRDIVQDNGYLVLDGDEEALYQAVEKVYLSSEAEFTAMKKAAWRIVQDYSAEKMTRLYEDLYREISN